MLRKHILKDHAVPVPGPVGIDIAEAATVAVSSEDAEHPIDNAFDGRRGPGGSRWIAGEVGDQTLILAFDTPQTLRHIILEIEEQEVTRQQQVEVSVSNDGERTYRVLRRQEYNFSPPGTTFEREEWVVREDEVTHLRVQVLPDKGGRPCRASITSLVLR
jgi:hypothetical protein